MRFPGRIRFFLIAGFFAVGSPAARASFHLIEITEVYSNADGSVQYVELKALADFQTQFQHVRIVTHSSDGTVRTLVFDFLAPFAALDNNETVLIATPAFQSVAGFAPDFIIPTCSRIVFPDGRIILHDDHAVQVIDSVAFGAYTGSNTGFGTPAVALPTDGVNSLTRIASSFLKDNSADFAVRPATPQRNDGRMTVLTGEAPHDCDASNAADVCEIVAGSLGDENDNFVLDVCEDRGDFDGDGDVDLGDYRRLHDCLDGPDGGILPDCDVQDLTRDEAVDLVDVAQLQNAMGTPPP